MKELLENPTHLAAAAALVLLAISSVITMVRLFIGPSLPDRVAALDMIAMIVIGMIAAYSIYAEQDVFLDVAIALALVIFLGTVAFARYLEKGLQK